HKDSTKRDPPADCFESIMCGSEVLGRPGEKFSKDPSPGMPWDNQWNSERMETSPTGQGFGGDVQYEQRGFSEQLDFFSTQENSLGKRLCVSSKCERSSSQLENLQGTQEGEVFPSPTCEKSLGERVFHLLPSQLGEKGLGVAPTSCEGPQLERGQPLPCGTLLGDPNHLMGEEQPPEESQETPPEPPTTSPCWHQTQDKAETCTLCPQHLTPKGAPQNPHQNQARGKSYICSDCGKSFVCHSWLVRHQMTHTGERPYKCSQCDKSYRRKDYLLNHQRRHSGQGGFQCPLCRKTFVLRRSFLKHQESHLQETHLPLPAWPCAEIRGAGMHSI
ncbi:ZN282 protein, partial [Atlantisia rogersi]|nr:ZN282 protein [Atlantisia rogersi]